MDTKLDFDETAPDGIHAAHLDTAAVEPDATLSGLEVYRHGFPG